jgi:hypothetical protein
VYGAGAIGGITAAARARLDGRELVALI